MKICKLIASMSIVGMLSGCVTGYEYRPGVGDYYSGQGQSSVDYYGYRDYGYDAVPYVDPYQWRSRIVLGYGLGGYGAFSYGSPFYGAPYRYGHYRYGGYPSYPHYLHYPGYPYRPPGAVSPGWQGYPHRPSLPHAQPRVPPTQHSNNPPPPRAFDDQRRSYLHRDPEARPGSKPLGSPRTGAPPSSPRPQIDRPMRTLRNEGRELLP